MSKYFSIAIPDPKIIKDFAEKVKTVKESYFKKETVESVIEDTVEDEDGNIVEATGTMAQYLTAIRKASQT